MNILKRLSAFLLVFVMLSGSAVAEDKLHKTYAVSSLDTSGSISQSGFTAQATVPSQKFNPPSPVACSDANYTGTAIEIKAASDAECRVIDDSWAAAGYDTVVFEMMLRPRTSGDDALTVLTKVNGAFYYLAQFKGSGLYGLTTSAPSQAISGITIEDKWYRVEFVFRTVPQKAVEMYVDGKLVKSETSAAFTKLFDDIYNSTGARHLRISTGKGSQSVLYLGNSNLYSPEPVKITAQNAEIDLPTDPVTIAFSRPIEVNSAGSAEFGGANVSVKDEDGNAVAVSSVTPVKNTDGRVTSATLYFAEDALSHGGKYSVEVTGCIGNYGQSVAAPEDGVFTFSVLPEPYDYKWKSVKVYKGLGSKKTAVGALSAGMISIEAEYANDGRLAKNVTLTAEIFESGTLVRRLETAKRSLGAGGDSQKTVLGFWLGSESSGTTVNLTLTDSDGNKLLEKKGAELFEN